MKSITLGQPENPFTAKVGSASSFIESIWTRFQASEWLLINLMVTDDKWQGSQPTIGDTTGGNLEYGVMLYLLNNTSDIQDSDLQEVIQLILAALIAYQVTTGVNLLPPETQLTSKNYNALSTDNIVWLDGSILGTDLYELYDQNWLAALGNLIASVLPGNIYGGGTLPVPAAGYTPIQATSLTGSDTITIGLLSDWGTGPGTTTDSLQAPSVMTALEAQSPDYVIHLGDVYYSGSPDSILSSTYDFILPDEENTNLVDAWPSSLAGRSFTLNSNHEMYSGGYGYFSDALQSSTFSAQNGFSMFALQVGDWTLLGLDSAYYSNPADLYMYGTLDQTQITWIQNLGLTASKTIVLTHHTGFDFDGSYTDPAANYPAFWEQITSALGGNFPYAWYWGHVHNGIVYQSAVTIPPSSTSGVQGTFCRCLGHAALPFGVATGLTVGQNNVQWFAKNAASSGLVYNGYVTLQFTLNSSNQVQSIQENFLDCSGTTTDTYSGQLFLATGS